MVRKRLILLVAVALALPLALSGCSIKRIALNAVADELSGGTGGSFTQDEDLQFVGDALPFALKLMESINDAVPEHPGMKLTLASGFVQYGVVFVEWPATQLKYDDWGAYQDGLDRASGFYRRGGDFALAGLDLNHAGFRSKIVEDTESALAEAGPEDVALLYWLGAAWLAMASTDLEDPEMFGLVPVGVSIIDRCYELDPGWSGGSIPELLITLEGLRPLPGGAERAKAHYDAVVAMPGGELKAGPHVSLATAVALKAQDKAGFVALLEKALAVDVEANPEGRLANEYAREKAQFLLDHVEDLFLE
jgi:predicted anti-sigma-YlaC factor YlaD